MARGAVFKRHMLGPGRPNSIAAFGLWIFGLGFKEDYLRKMTQDVVASLHQIRAFVRQKHSWQRH